MTETEKIQELISEGKIFSFSKNCYTVDHGTYSRPSIDLQVWIADCEDFILSNYGDNSVPWRLFKEFHKIKLEGYYQDEFDKQIAIIISALKVCLRISSKLEKEISTQKSKMDLSQVFIVHGHDEVAKTKTARFVEKLGFEAIILNEQVSSSKTIIEKIEEYSNVGFGIILYTPCDIGGKQSASPDLKARARQNVVFEHGFLIGKIGRGNVCALVKGDIETPNDISGVVYVAMDNADAWRYHIAKELKKVGYNIDLNKI